jgi:hypothetical protein
MSDERLKKLEADLKDLEQWLNLGLVPKKDLEKHKEELRLLEEKIRIERERLRKMKETEDFDNIHLKKARKNTLDITGEFSDPGMEVEEEENDFVKDDGRDDSSPFDDEDDDEDDDDDDDPFSDSNRWRRAILDNPIEYD